MDRRTFLKSSGAAVAATGATVAADETQARPANTQARVEIATVLAPSSTPHYLRDRADRLALRIGALSDGRIKLAILDSPAGGVDAIRRGLAVACFGCDHDYTAAHPALNYFQALPGDLGLAPADFATWMTAAGGQMYCDEVYEGLGLKALPAGHSGRQPGLWSTMALDSLADLAGHRIMTTGLAGDVARGLGLANCNRDTAACDVDVVEPLAGQTAFLAAQPAPAHRFWYRDGINRSGVALSLTLDRQVWETIGAAAQATIAAAASEAYNQALAEHSAHDGMVAGHLMQARGVTSAALPADIQRAITHLAREAVVRLAATDRAAAGIHENYMQFREIITGLPNPLHAAAVV